MESGEEPGSASLFLEVFQSTSSGDVGLQLSNGILFRCHSTVLHRAGGFLEKLRSTCRGLSLKSAHKDLDHWDFAASLNRPHLLRDLKLLRLSKVPAALNKGARAHSDRIYAVGATTASQISGSTGALARRDPYVLAERYELQPNMDYEHVLELLRFVYCDYLYYERLPISSESEKKDKVRLMRDMLLLADRFSVDTLYDRCIEFFMRRCFLECGLQPFTDLYFQLEHYMGMITEPLFLQRLKQALVEMTFNPVQLRAVARDTRWCSLSCELLFDILDADGLAVAQESDVVGLIERWNAHADKTKDDIARLMTTCRETPDAPGAPGALAGGVRKSMMNAPNFRKSLAASKHGESHAAPVNNKPPRRNVFVEDTRSSVDLSPAESPKGPNGAASAVGPDTEQSSKSEQTSGSSGEVAEQTFTQVDGTSAIATGFTFYLGQGESILQKNSFRKAGSYRLRASFKQPELERWPKDQEVFLGANFGTTKYFGYLISATDFEGIYRVGVVSGASGTMAEPIFITGSASRVELDCELNIRVPKVNGIVQCNFVLYFNNINVGIDAFQLTEETMTDGPGLRYMVTSTGLHKSTTDGQETIYVQLSWLRGGAAEDSVKAT